MRTIRVMEMSTTNNTVLSVVDVSMMKITVERHKSKGTYPPSGHFNHEQDQGTRPGEIFEQFDFISM